MRIGILLPFGTGAGRVQPCIGLTTEVWTTWFFFIYGPWVRVRESYHLALGLVESNCALLGINIPTFEGGKLHTPVHRYDDRNQYIYMILLIYIHIFDFNLLLFSDLIALNCGQRKLLRRAFHSWSRHTHWHLQPIMEILMWKCWTYNTPALSIKMDIMICIYQGANKDKDITCSRFGATPGLL